MLPIPGLFCVSLQPAFLESGKIQWLCMNISDYFEEAVETGTIHRVNLKFPLICLQLDYLLPASFTTRPCRRRLFTKWIQTSNSPNMPIMLMRNCVACPVDTLSKSYMMKLREFSIWWKITHHIPLKMSQSIQRCFCLIILRWSWWYWRHWTSNNWKIFIG